MPTQLSPPRRSKSSRFSRVVGARRIAGRRPDAAVLLADELRDVERLVLAVAPVAPRALVQPLGERLGQAVGERLEHDRGVGIVGGVVRRDELVRAEPGRDREGADPVVQVRLARRHEVGERLGRLPVALRACWRSVCSVPPSPACVSSA